MEHVCVCIALKIELRIYTVPKILVYARIPTLALSRSGSWVRGYTTSSQPAELPAPLLIVIISLPLNEEKVNKTIL